MKLIKSAFFVGLIILPFLSFADNLKIANRTRFNLSLQVSTRCSDEVGSINSNTIKIVDEKMLKNICSFSVTNHCIMFFYSQPNCKGVRVAEIGLHAKDGVTYIGGMTNQNDPISITANGFNLIFTSPIKS